MTQKEYWNILLPLIPRILGQIDRDPDSPTYGSFDRNYWNYKIRDFSSAIIQQGILVLDVLYTYKSEENPYYQSKFMKGLVEAGVNFWIKIQLKNGGFNEYYPFEAGFPPSAFSLYAVSLLYGRKEYQFDSKLDRAIEKTFKWLLKHPEKEALNQESAALAGMAIISTKADFTKFKADLEERLKTFYQLQNSEGWFNEYGGPDIGYLSVTVDCLYDIYLHCKDERALCAAKNAVGFINNFVTINGQSPVMINSRNTDYIVPYGIASLSGKNEEASELISKLMKPLPNWDNQLYKTDDRYLCHYIGQSFFRTVLNKKTRYANIETTDKEHFFKNAGIFIKQQADNALFVSLRKGGIVNSFNAAGIVKKDYGVRVTKGKHIAVTHWQDENYTYNATKTEKGYDLNVSGNMSQHKFLRPSPIAHIGLRILSKTLGNKLIPLLKGVLIFGDNQCEYKFHRKIIIEDLNIELRDSFTGIEFNKLLKAPIYSLRHVSSAGRYTNEEN